MERGKKAKTITFWGKKLKDTNITWEYFLLDLHYKIHYCICVPFKVDVTFSILNKE